MPSAQRRTAGGRFRPQDGRASRNQLTIMASWDRRQKKALLRRGVCFHASSVGISGKAVIFLGHSGAGKSTLGRLLSKGFPLIADDRVLIHQGANGVWTVRDASGSKHLPKSYEGTVDRGHFPLLAIIRIYQSDINRIEPISPKKACMYLSDAIYEVDFQRKYERLRTRKGWFSIAAEISRTTRGYALTFKNDRSIIRLIAKAFCSE